MPPASKINNVFFLIFGQGINFVFNLLMLPITIRQLSLNDYGVYSQVVMVTATLYAILSFGVTSGIIVFFNRNKKYSQNILLNILLAIIVFLTLVYVFLCLFHTPIETALHTTNLWFFLRFFYFSILFQIAIDLFYAYFIFFQKIKLASYLTVITNVFRLSFIFVAIVTTHNLQYIFGAQLLSLVLCASVYFYFFKSKHIFLNFKYNASIITSVFKLCIPLSLTGIIGTLLIQTDGYLVNYYLGKNEFAIYRSGAFEIPFLSTVYSSISLIFFPEIKQLLYDKNYERIIMLKRKIIFNSSLLIYPLIIVFLFFGNELIATYLGNRFVRSAAVFVGYNLILFIRINDYSDVLTLTHQTKFIFLVYGVAFVLNLILGSYFVNIFGLVGPVYATFIAILFIAIAQLHKVTSILTTNIVYFFNFYKVVLTLIANVALIWLVYLFFFKLNFPNAIQILGTIITYLAIHFFIIFKFSIIDSSITTKIKSILHKKWV
ncbi:MAG: oligosaccharide flippase family protein [Bacteroidia bacterium]|nr:oligosaccharide flippase family protein [Bacteroidia bacterium]